MTRKILIDITHPAHFHFFRPAMEVWQQKGHTLIVVARDKDITLQLLEGHGYLYTCLSKARKAVLGLGIELIEHEGKLLNIIRKTHPDILLEIAGTFIVHAGFLTGTPSLVFYDSEHARLSNAITYPFASRVITPDCYRGNVGKKHTRYAGYQELAYLHPNRFQPDPTVLAELGLAENDKFFVLRFVSWAASHDSGQYGLSDIGKRRLIAELQKLGRVVITSEPPLPPEFEPFRMSISPIKIHHLLYYSSLYIGEGATMASEAAMLGTPSIYVNSITAGTLEEQEQKYGLVHRSVDEEQVIALATRLARDKNARADYQQKCQRMLADKIDVTAWLVDFIESYPDALHNRKNGQDYHLP